MSATPNERAAAASRLDQLFAATAEAAAQLATMYKTLVTELGDTEHGRAAALSLTQTYISAVIIAAGQRPPQPPEGQ